jgi:Family of unknown function (DUF6152)
MSSVRILLVFTVVLACPTSVVAHHSLPSEFDLEKHVTVTGVVSLVEWMNPHVWIFLNVKDSASGKITRWAVQLPSPNMLYRFGWSREPFKPGLTVTVSAFPAKDGSTRGSAQQIVSSGRKIFAEFRAQN